METNRWDHFHFRNWKGFYLLELELLRRNSVALPTSISF